MATILERRSGNSSRLMLTAAIWFFTMTCVFVTLGQATFAAQTYFKWDPSQNGTGSDGMGNWDASSTLWTAGSTDVKWANTVNSSNVASFGSNNAAAGTVTLTTAIWADGLSFSPAGSGDYTIAAAAPADTLTLGDSVTVPVGASPTISSPIAGTFGLSLCGGGTLNISGANTYTGATTIYGGTLNVLAGGTLGSGSSFVSLGPEDRTGFGNLNVNSSLSIDAIVVESSSTTANTVSVPSGQTLSIAYGIDVLPYSSLPGATSGFLTITGGGSVIANGLTVGGFSSAGTAGLDLSGMSSFSCNASGSAFSIGMYSVGQATVTLAGTNTITTPTLSVGTSGGTSGTLNLGSVSTTIKSTTINIGTDTSTGTVDWSGTTTTGTLSLGGTSSNSRVTTLTVGSRSEASGAVSSGSLLLDGHSVNVLAGTLVIGQTTGTASETGTVAFDTGTFDVTSVNVSQRASGASVGTFTLGSGSSSTGTLIVNSASGPGGGYFSLADSTTAATAANCNGTFDIKGGTANVNCDITMNVSPSTGVAGPSGTIILEGGTLNMMGHNIGGAAAANNVTLNATGGTLENVKSIDGGGGLAMTGTGSLSLAGTNAWTGPTSVSNGTLMLIANSTLGDTAISVASGAILNMMAGSAAGNTATAASGATLAGTTGGATFSLEDNGLGTFTLTQGSNFSGVAFTLGGDTLDFDISNLGADEILDSGPGKASVGGVNIINLDALTPTLTPGAVYTLISDPSGGLAGSFEFSNSLTTESLEGYTLSLSNSSTAETLTVSVPEPGAAAAMALVAGVMLIRARRRKLGGAAVL